MTVNSTNYISTSSGNGSSTTFDYAFKIQKSSHLVVKHKDTVGNETTLVEGTDYSVSGVGKSAGGTITFPLGASSFSTLAVGEKLTKYRKPPVTQLTDIRNQQAYHPENIEDALDLIIMILQRFTSASLVDEVDTTQFDARSLRIANLTDPKNSQDAATQSWVQGQISSIADGVLGVVPNQWSGTTDGSATVSITGTTLDEEKGYIVSLGGVIQQPTTDFTVDDTTDTLTWTSTPGSGIPYWIIAFGYARQVNEYPAHDHPEEFMPYNAGGTANAITMTVPSGRIAPSAYTDQMCGVFTPNITNTLVDVTANVQSIGAKTVVLRDGATKPPIGFINTGRKYFWQYDSSLDKIVILSPYIAETIEIKDDAVTLAKMASGTAGHRITYDASGNPQTEIDRKWVKLGDSGQLTSGGSASFENIPSSATKVEIEGFNIQASANTELMLRVGYGATPTILSASGDYIGSTIYTSAAGDAVNAWDTYARITTPRSANNACCFKVTMSKINDGSSDTWFIDANSHWDNGSNEYLEHAGGMIKAASLAEALSAVEVGLLSGTFSDGYMSCHYYGNPNV